MSLAFSVNSPARVKAVLKRRFMLGFILFYAVEEDVTDIRTNCLFHFVVLVTEKKSLAKKLVGGSCLCLLCFASSGSYFYSDRLDALR